VKPLVLLQTSDWHVGSVLGGGALGLPADLREARREEIDGAPERAVAAAKEADADALLVPGDLWDAESVPPSSIHRLIEALASFAPRPVFIAPGNHDFAGAGGYYDPEVLRALGMRSWPENVTVFRGPEFAAAAFPGREDVAVVGRAFLSSAALEERPLARTPQRPPVETTILLLHGSHESYRGADAPTGAKKTAPFSTDELLRCGFTWSALGHHHHLDVVEGASGVPRAAYSGAPTGRGLDECGPRVFLKVTIDDGGARVETVPADTRVVRDLTLDVTGLEGADIASRAFALLDEKDASARDLVRLTLTGSRSHGARPAAALGPVSGRVAHLAVRDKTVVAAGLEALDHRTAEGRFVQDLLARRAAASDAYARRVADLALALGRDALAGRPLAATDPEDA
jgi:DNA repair exonuclease SbcCD nuclease subunit